MNRRMFLKVSAAVPAVVVASQLPGPASVARAQQKEFAPRPGTWRTFELTTRVEVLQPSGVARVWLPAPSVVSDYQQSIENNWAGNAKVHAHSDRAQVRRRHALRGIRRRRGGADG